jgi:hypothetical protein
VSSPRPHREGRATIVFDVRDSDVAQATDVVSGWHFAVRPYYPERVAGSYGGTPGWTRLAADRDLTEFTEAELAGIVAEFSRGWDATHIAGQIVGTEQWTASGGDGGDGSGVREPRRPVPTIEAGSAAAGD